jgi:hypothetical protein
MAMIERGESACIVGVAGTGKSNLIHFMRQREAQERYLPERASRLHFVTLSCLPGTDPRDSIYAAMIDCVWQIARDCQAEEDELPAAVSPLQALRGALDVTCGTLRQQVVFVFDEFDCLIRNQPAGFFDDLRVLRDDHRTTGNVVFLVITRILPQLPRGPEPLRDSKFFQLIRDRIYPLPPFREADAVAMLDDQMRRQKGTFDFPLRIRKRLAGLAGGHAALLLSLFETLKPDFSHVASAPEALVAAPRVANTCADIWNDLHWQEQESLIDMAQDRPVSDEVRSYLCRRGLVAVNGSRAIFSPVFREFVRTLPE